MVTNRALNKIFRTWSNVAVLRTLLNTNTGFSGNGVSRVAGMNPRSVFKALTSLEELDIVNRVFGGRDNIFILNRKHFLVQQIILKIYPVECKFLDEVVSALSAILKRHVYRAVIFGRVARKDEKSSALNQLRRIIEEKTKVSYLGELYTSSQTKEMLKRLDRFRKWSLEILNR